MKKQKNKTTGLSQPLACCCGYMWETVTVDTAPCRPYTLQDSLWTLGFKKIKGQCDAPRVESISKNNMLDVCSGAHVWCVIGLRHAWRLKSTGCVQRRLMDVQRHAWPTHSTNVWSLPELDADGQMCNFKPVSSCATEIMMSCLLWCVHELTWRMWHYMLIMVCVTIQNHELSVPLPSL